MANYSKTTWVDGSAPAITAAKLNNMETGIGESRWYGTTTNSGNNYSITLDPAASALYAGMRVTTKINATNTGAVTLNCNALGAKTCKMPNGDAIPSGKLVVDSVYSWVYNGTDFFLMGSDSTGDATDGDVLAGKKFSNAVGTGLTGTLALTGDAAVGDVLKSKTFYNTDAKTKGTGTLELTGSAAAGDVLTGKTFYNTNAKSKQTGTLADYTSADRATDSLTISGTTLKLSIPDTGKYSDSYSITHTDANRIAANIKKGVTFDGLTGTCVFEHSMQFIYYHYYLSYAEGTKTKSWTFSGVPRKIIIVENYDAGSYDFVRTNGDLLNLPYSGTPIPIHSDGTFIQLNSLTVIDNKLTAEFENIVSGSTSYIYFCAVVMYDA
ncbi:MAG: hypothetical protein M0R74_13740 [Dehalococcoidia bacterium]|nr:hypothetical protein [Dehalococcoidia bacterium]